MPNQLGDKDESHAISIVTRIFCCAWFGQYSRLQQMGANKASTEMRVSRDILQGSRLFLRWLIVVWQQFPNATMHRRPLSLSRTATWVATPCDPTIPDRLLYIWCISLGIWFPYTSTPLIVLQGIKIFLLTISETMCALSKCEARLVVAARDGIKCRFCELRRCFHM